MAIIRELIHVPGKEIHAQSEIVAEYSMDDSFFSIWSYKAGDLTRSGGSKQNMQLDKTLARQLRDALDRFLKQ